MESFFHTLKTELVMHCDYKTRDQARASLFDYMEVFYNRQRRHSTLNYEAPLAFEAMQIVDFPRNRGHPAASRRGLLEGLGTDPAEMTVAAGSIVEDLDVVEDVGPRQLARLVDAFADALLLQAAEERLGHGVDAPMSSLANGIRQVGQDQRVQLANDVALEATLNLFR